MIKTFSYCCRHDGSSGEGKGIDGANTELTPLTAFKHTEDVTQTLSGHPAGVSSKQPANSSVLPALSQVPYHCPAPSATHSLHCQRAQAGTEPWAQTWGTRGRALSSGTLRVPSCRQGILASCPGGSTAGKAFPSGLLPPHHQPLPSLRLSVLKSSSGHCLLLPTTGCVLGKKVPVGGDCPSHHSPSRASHPGTPPSSD